ncbi:MAG: ribosome-recycling factor [Candidatus Dojkabacteria bacterium]|nr:MAG: ribosome-recycling factor [Candidatus Dojkabacteria bacterium]
MLYNEAELKNKLEKIVKSFETEIKKIRSGKASMDIFENIEVNAYGTKNKLTAVANVMIEDALNVRINIWDKSVVPNVEEAIRDANLGASIIIEKDHIRLRFSPLTEEVRLASVKELRRLLEEYKIKIRQVRQDFLKDLGELDGVSEDEQKRDEKSIQKHIDDYIAKLDNIAKNKEESIMKL